MDLPLTTTDLAANPFSLADMEVLAYMGKRPADHAADLPSPASRPPHVCQAAHVCQRSGVGKHGQTRAPPCQVCPSLPTPFPWQTWKSWHTWGKGPPITRPNCRRRPPAPSCVPNGPCVPTFWGWQVRADTGVAAPALAASAKPFILGRHGSLGTHGTKARPSCGRPAVACLPPSSCGPSFDGWQYGRTRTRGRQVLPTSLPWQTWARIHPTDLRKDSGRSA